MTTINRDDVLAAVNLADLLTREVGQPKRVGSQLWWPSVEPGNAGTGKTPPTHIVPVTAASRGAETFKDFNTGRSGTAIDLLMIRRGLDFKAALDLLAAETGIDRPVAQRRPGSSPLPRPGQPQENREGRPERPRPQPPSPELLQWVWDCNARLVTPSYNKADHARRWLADRGYSDQNLADHLVGYDPGARNDVNRPRSERARWGIPNMAGITFPMFDAAGNIAYVQTRSLTWAPDSEYPKYVSPAGVLNPRFGVWAETTSRAGTPIVVTEGPTDALAVREAGCDVVGLIGVGHANDPGTAARLTATFGTDRPWIVMTDPDPAGRLAGHTLVVNLWTAGAAAVYRPPPPGTGDVADWLRSTGDGFRRALASHVTRALADISHASRRALAGDPAFITEAADGELLGAAAEIWARFTAPAEPVATHQPSRPRRQPRRTEAAAGARTTAAARAGAAPGGGAVVAAAVGVGS